MPNHNNPGYVDPTEAAAVFSGAASLYSPPPPPQPVQAFKPCPGVYEASWGFFKCNECGRAVSKVNLNPESQALFLALTEATDHFVPA